MQGSLLASAAPERRGCAASAPRPGTGVGPRGAARHPPSAPGRPGPRSARPSSPPRPFTPERRRWSRVCPAEGEGRARGGGGGVVVPMRRGLLCPCAEMTHGVPSRHARAQRTDTHKERGKYTAPACRPQQLPGPPRPGPPRASPTLRTCATPHPTWRQTRRGPALQSTELVSQVSAGRIKLAARRQRLQGRRTGDWLQHPCWGGGGSRGGDAKGGCPERARREERPPPRRAEPPSEHPAPTGSPRPLCRAPLCAARNAAAPWRPREHARRAGAEGGREVEWSVLPPLPAPLAPPAGPAPLPVPAMERPGPPEGSAEPVGARRSRLAGLWRGTVQREERGVRAE